MSSSLALFCLPSVKKHKHEFFCFVQCIIKQLLDSVFVISRIIKVLVRVISLSLQLRLITPTLTLIILDITKTSSNNCLQFEHCFLYLLIQLCSTLQHFKVHIVLTCSHDAIFYTVKVTYDECKTLKWSNQGISLLLVWSSSLTRHNSWLGSESILLYFVLRCSATLGIATFQMYLAILVKRQRMFSLDMM